jgi:hypothetical protein
MGEYERRTLGDLEAAGDIPPLGGLKYDVLLGGDWRSLTVDEAKEALNGATTREEREVAVVEEQERIVAKMTEHVDRGESISEALAKKVLDELYGDRPPRAALDAMLAVMGHVQRYPPARR